MTLLTTLNLNLDPVVGCPPTVTRVDPALGGIFGDGVRVVDVLGVLIPPQLNQTIASQEFGEDPDTELVYFLLRRFCTAFSDSILDSILGAIRAKVLQTQDLSLLTDDERVQVRTLNRIYNTSFDGLISVGTVAPEFGLIE